VYIGGRVEVSRTCRDGLTADGRDETEYPPGSRVVTTP
jgi:hypothetical protein